MRVLCVEGENICPDFGIMLAREGVGKNVYHSKSGMLYCVSSVANNSRI